MTSVDQSLVTDAVLGVLRAEFEPGILIGDGELPDLAEQPTTRDQYAQGAYAVLSSIPTGHRDEGGGWSGDGGMLWIRYQIYVVAGYRDQAERIANAMASRIADRADGQGAGFLVDIPVAGHAIIDRRRAGMIPLDSTGPAVRSGQLVDIRVQVAS